MVPFLQLKVKSQAIQDEERQRRVLDASAAVGWHLWLRTELLRQTPLLADAILVYCHMPSPGTHLNTTTCLTAYNLVLCSRLDTSCLP